MIHSFQSCTLLLSSLQGSAKAKLPCLALCNFISAFACNFCLNFFVLSQPGNGILAEHCVFSSDQSILGVSRSRVVLSRISSTLNVSFVLPFRAWAWSCTWWCAGRCPSTPATSTRCGTASSPAGSGSLSSCPQVSRLILITAQFRNLIFGVLNVMHWWNDMILQVAQQTLMKEEIFPKWYTWSNICST